MPLSPWLSSSVVFIGNNYLGCAFAVALRTFYHNRCYSCSIIAIIVIVVVNIMAFLPSHYYPFCHIEIHWD